MTTSASALLCFLCLAAWTASTEGRKKEYASATTCEAACRGDRDAECAQTSAAADARFTCQCLAGYFPAEEEDACDAECGDQYWSLFTYGTCFQSDATNGSCRYRCGWRVRVWTTVFLFVLFTAAVVTLLTMLPMMISSCVACATVRKDRKQRKKVDLFKQAARESSASARHSQVGGPTSEYDVATIRSTAGSTQPIYASSNAVVPVHNSNPRLNYWSHYYYQ